MILCTRLHSLILNENASLKRIVDSGNFKEDIRQSTCRREAAFLLYFEQD